MDKYICRNCNRTYTSYSPRKQCFICGEEGEIAVILEERDSLTLCPLHNIKGCACG